MNASQTAQSLLSLPSSVTAPDPYLVLGLAPGESDPAKIAAAIKAVVSRLNDAKPSAESAAWNQAAIWVKESRRIISDPALKSRLDQKLSSGSRRAASSSADVLTPPAAPVLPKAPSREVSAVPQSAISDPLANLLPSASNQASTPPSITTNAGVHFRPGNISGSVAPARHATVPLPPGVVSPTTLPPSALPPGFGSGQQPTFGQVYRPPVPLPDQSSVGVESFASAMSAGRRRKKRFPWAALTLVALTLGSIAGIVAMVVYLNKNPGGITIALQTDGGVATAVSGPDATAGSVGKKDDSPRDNVMGALGPATRRGSGGRPVGETDGQSPVNPASAFVPPAETPPAMPDRQPPMAPEVDAMPDASKMTDPSMGSVPEGDAPPTTVPNMAEIPGVVDPTAEQLAAAEAAFSKARQVLSSANWGEMNSAAELALRAAATPDQKTLATQLVQLAELATYYQVGVEKALDGLKSNETFNVTDQLQISVVEITQTKVILRFNGRNKEYIRSELPLVVVHKIAGFTMPIDKPETQAAAQAYQALAPISTPQYRQQAINSLESMPPMADDVNPADLVAAIRFVLTK